jgi:hypothetical protein
VAVGRPRAQRLSDWVPNPTNSPDPGRRLPSALGEAQDGYSRQKGKDTIFLKKTLHP